MREEETTITKAHLDSMLEAAKQQAAIGQTIANTLSQIAATQEKMLGKLSNGLGASIIEEATKRMEPSKKALESMQGDVRFTKWCMSGVCGVTGLVLVMETVLHFLTKKGP